MKSPYVILVFLAFGSLFTACSKQGSSSVNVSPITKDTSRVLAAAVSQLPVGISYPYTDTFLGSMKVSLAGYAYDSTNPDFRFYVTYLSQDQIVARSGGAIELELYGTGIININDTLRTGSGDSMRGKMLLFPVEGRQETVPDAITFDMHDNTLVVNWDIQYIQVLGSCDMSESIGHFNGSLRPRLR